MAAVGLAWLGGRDPVGRGVGNGGESGDAEAGSGEEAVAIAGVLRPDVVLMDGRLPGINGPDARQILSDNPRTKVILVSTHEAADLPDLDSCGAMGFLRKQDFDAQALLD